MEALVEELLVVRRRGLMRLDGTVAPLLARVVAERGLGDAGTANGVEQLLRHAVRDLEPGRMAAAAAETFGLPRSPVGRLADGLAEPDDHRDLSAGERRNRAAKVYSLSTERFRREQERLIVTQVAVKILEADGTGRRAASDPPAPGTPISLFVARPTGTVRIRVHTGPIELLRDVDIVVSSTNVYFEPSKIYASTLSGALRQAAAVRDDTGAIVSDVVADGLRDWLVGERRLGVASPVGTVVPTQAGQLAVRGVRRLYHAAVAVPRTGGVPGYEVTPAGVVAAVHNAMRIGRAERVGYDPPLASICFPLFGAGRGGLSVDTSVRSLWAGLERELDVTPRLSVHLTVHRIHTAEAVRDILLSLGATSGFDDAMRNRVRRLS